MAVFLAGCGAEGAGPDADAPGTQAGVFGVLSFFAEPLVPPAEGVNAFRVELRDLRSDEPLVGADLTATVVMPSMGHETPSDIVVSEPEAGLYEVTNVIFAMPGVWEVRYRAEKGTVGDVAAFSYEVR